MMSQLKVPFVNDFPTLVCPCLKVTSANVTVHQALKSLTEGEARCVIMSIPGGNGFQAWRALHQRHGLSLLAQQGKAMSDVVQLIQKPAKTPADTRTLVTELERRVRISEEISGKAMDDMHVKSVLIGVLDPITRQHRSQFQGVNTTYQDLRRCVLEFTNNNVAIKSTDPDAMVIGAVADANGNPYLDGLGLEESWDIQPQEANAITASTQCHKCRGYGHIASQCPSKGTGAPGGGKSNATDTGYGKATGKGWGQPVKGAPVKGGAPAKGTGAVGKGTGKGPKGGCWTCGGPHFASASPALAGKGSVGKGVHTLAQFACQWPTPAEWASGMRSLSSVSTAVTGNRFDALSEDEDLGDEASHRAVLGDFPPRVRIPQRQQKQQAQKMQLSLIHISEPTRLLSIGVCGVCV